MKTIILSLLLAASLTAAEPARDLLNLAKQSPDSPEFKAALGKIIKGLNERNEINRPRLMMPPYRLDDCGWVANRWCELLPLPLAARQKLMALDDPVIRLSLVDGYLRDKKVIVG